MQKVRVLHSDELPTGKLLTCNIFQHPWTLNYMLLYKAALIPPDVPRMKLSQLQRELCMQKVRGGVVREENGASRQNVGELTFKSVL